jgi:hypothetical protein
MRVPVGSGFLRDGKGRSSREGSKCEQEKGS